jgi:hypothetical protein
VEQEVSTYCSTISFALRHKKLPGITKYNPRDYERQVTLRGKRAKYALEV